MVVRWFVEVDKLFHFICMRKHFFQCARWWLYPTISLVMVLDVDGSGKEGRRATGGRGEGREAREGRGESYESIYRVNGNTSNVSLKLFKF